FFFSSRRRHTRSKRDWSSDVCSSDLTRPKWRELDDEVLRRATIYVESREGAPKESGDMMAAGKEPVEIGEVIAGKQAARTSADETTLCKSVAVAAEDVAAADLVYKRETERVSQ